MRSTFLSALLGIIIFINSLCTKAQESPKEGNEVFNSSEKFLQKIQSKTTRLERMLIRQKEKYITRLENHENKLKHKLKIYDKEGADQLFNDLTIKYEQFKQRPHNSLGSVNVNTGDYLPYLDSLIGSLAFLNKHPDLLNGSSIPEANLALSAMRQYQMKLKQAENLKSFIRNRKEVLQQYFEKHSELSKKFKKDLQAFNNTFFNYSQHIQEFRDTWSHPDKLEQKALSILGNIPAFQQFMKENSALSGLFSIPANYSSNIALNELQTRDEVQKLMQNHLPSALIGSQDHLSQQMEQVRNQFGEIRNKVNKMGNNSGDISIPDFSINPENRKTLLQRLEFGFDIQTTKSNYLFPMFSDLGISMGYKLSPKSKIGIGLSYKLGFGTGWDQLRLTSEGTGIRSFANIKLKGKFFIAGGYEMNYFSSFRKFDDLKTLYSWKQSALIGVSKKYQISQKRKGELKLLYDFLHNRHIPQTQAIVIRTGYSF